MNTISMWNNRLTINEYTQRRIPFGKHKGQRVIDLPTDYIKWGIQNLGAEWATYLSRELQRREPKWKR